MMMLSGGGEDFVIRGSALLSLASLALPSDKEKVVHNITKRMHDTTLPQMPEHSRRVACNR